MSRDLKDIGMEVLKEAMGIAVVKGSGRLVMESIVATKASSILQFIHGLRGELHVTWEEGTWAAWRYDLLQPQVHEVLDGGTPEVVPGSALPDGLFALPPVGVSPDGQLLTFTGMSNDARTPVGKIALVPVNSVPGGRARFLDPDPRIAQSSARTDVRFTPDGKAMVYAIRENGTITFGFSRSTAPTGTRSRILPRT